MRLKTRNILIVMLLAASGFWFSCITDEFRLKDLSIDEEWEVGITTPLFIGNLEFRDFIYDWGKKPVPDLPGPKVVLDFDDRTDLEIPVELIFDESAVIDSFPFYIQGSYEFSEVKMIFRVENGCPFPLNLKLYFYESEDLPNTGPAIQPKPFREADFSRPPITPVLTTDTLKLDDNQLAWFKKGKLVLFKAWYDQSSYVIQDTIDAQYPIKVSIIVNGKVKAKQDD